MDSSNLQSSVEGSIEIKRDVLEYVHDQFESKEAHESFMQNKGVYVKGTNSSCSHSEGTSDLNESNYDSEIDDGTDGDICILQHDQNEKE